ncbi:MAG: DUF445 domain-containing protein, partial [Verrucomicrobiota bacterium]|nr:DUF445 domain-containing protein [Verrucomicrobiota bacterium]
AIRWVFWALFAKKRREIAVAVREVVSNDLMSPDKIAARLAAPEVSASIERAALAALSEAAARALPSLDTLAGAYAELRLDALRARLAGHAARAVADRLADPAFRADVLRPVLDAHWQRLAPCRVADLLPAQTRDRLLAGLPDRLAEAALAPERRAPLCAALSDALRAGLADAPTPAALLGPAPAASLAAWAGSRADLIGGELALLLATPSAQDALRAALRAAVQTRLGGLRLGPVGPFLQSLSGAALVENQLARFCETIPSAVRAQCADAEGAPRMRGLAEDAARALLSRTWDDLLGGDAPDLLARQLSALLDSGAVRDAARAGFARVCAAALDTLQDQPLAALSGALSADAPGFLAEALHTALCAPDVRLQLERQTEAAVRQLCARPIGPPGRFLPEGAQPRLAAFIAAQLTGFARANLTDLVERTRIWDIISDSIIALDAKEMERLTRDVANRELRWVTFLGGVIGFIVGIAQGVLLLFL